MKTFHTVVTIALTLALATSRSAQAAPTDHLTCYKIKDPQAKALYTADVGGLVQHSGCLIKVPAVMACVAASQTNIQPAPPATGGIGTPNAFGCYKVKCPKNVLPTFQLSDQFGDRVVTAKTAKLACAPALPTTTTTVTTTTSTSVTTTTAPPAGLCDLPGSIQFTASGQTTVPGGPVGAADLSFLHLPVGFCAHYYGTVGNARRIRVAPSGELFVTSPTNVTTDGGFGGTASIVVLPDDDADGTADSTLTFESSLPSTQGLAFAPGYLYYQDGIDVRRVPYASGDRTPSAASELVATIDGYISGLNWPKSIDVANDGTVYVTNADDAQACDPMHPFRGGILSLASLHGTPVAGGMFNPTAVRCQSSTGACFALDLAKSYSGMANGRDKFVEVQAGADFGYACCASGSTPYSDVSPTPDCSGVTKELAAFTADQRLSGLDFTPSSWPVPFDGKAIVSVHGALGLGTGARIATTLTSGGLTVDFSTGWDDGTFSHGQPSDVTVGPDGRLFVANDKNGVIFWVAPMQ